MKNNKFILILGVLFFGVSISSMAQKNSVSLGNMYIPANGSVAIFSDHNFQETGNGMLPGILATDRSVSNGRIVFSQNSSWKNADEFRHVDGFVGAHVNRPFLLPLGDNGIYAPIGLSNALDVQSAYYAVDPSFAITSKVLSDEYTEVPESGPFNIDEVVHNVDKVSDREYWVVKGENPTRVTLTWSSHSNVEQLVESDLFYLSIVGWDGSQWVEIPSSINKNKLNVNSSDMKFSQDNSGFSSGSIISNEEILPSDYYAVSFGKLQLEKDISKNEIKIYPNPVSVGSHINVRYELAKSTNGQIKIFDSSSKLIFSQKLSLQKDKIEVPLNKYQRGVFNVAITSQNGTTTYQKLIVVDL